MSETNNKITIEELETYLYSLDDQKTKEKETKINEYKDACEEIEEETNERKMNKIWENVNKEYKPKMEAREEILKLLEECSELQWKMEKLEAMKYMVKRINIRSAENVLLKITAKLSRKYNDIVETIEKEFVIIDEANADREIDFSIYRPSTKEVEEVKGKYKEIYTNEDRMQLIQNELDVIEKAKVFNTKPIPHEILKNSDKDLQSKMQKFNSVRQKRLRILSTMEADYLKMQEPRQINTMIDDAIENLGLLDGVATKAEYGKVKKYLLKERKRIYKGTSELRSIIKSKEKRAGVVNYNIQEARYNRMDALGSIVNEANKIISENQIPGVEEQLSKLQQSYEREKQFANILQKLNDDPENNENANDSQDLKSYEKQIANLNARIENSRKIIAEQEEKISKAKKELNILWKMEIDTTISKKKEEKALPEAVTFQNTENIDNVENAETKATTKNIFLKLRKMQEEKHACI